MDLEPYYNAFVGIAIVGLCLVVLAQAFHAYREEDWVCSRAAYRAVWAGGSHKAAVPCTEETNLRTGEVRVTKWGKE